MKSAPPLLLIALFCSLAAGVQARDPSNVDATKQATDLAPGSEQTTIAPEQKPIERNDHLQDSRFSTPELREKEKASVGDRRAAIDVTETREKNVIERKDAPKPEVREHEQNHQDGKKARIQPKGDQVKKYDMVSKYQSRMTDADAAAAQRQPKMEKRTSFEKLNRFIFQRNGPGSSDGRPMVTPAAGGPAPAASDLNTQYQVKEWKRLNQPR